MDDLDWQRWFELHGENAVRLYFFSDRVGAASVNELYQAFRARFLDELLDASMARGSDDVSALLADIKYRQAVQPGESKK